MNRREMLKALGVSAAGAYGLGLLQGDAGIAQPADGGPAVLGDAIFADGQFKLPPLPYAYDALEPVIDQQTVTIHHDRHHAAYVAGLNRAIAGLAEARKAGNFENIQSLARDAAFHGSGHVLHSLYWVSMAPRAGGEPKGELAKAIAADFGNFNTFREEMSAATTRVEASGWGVLVFDPFSRHLRVLQAERHQDLSIWGVVPLMVIDAWEHAYYLKYQNRRADYVRAFWDVVNWDGVEQRMQLARRLTL